MTTPTPPPSDAPPVGVPLTDGWIAHDGGPNPVPGQRVDAKGSRFTAQLHDVLSETLRWDRVSSYRPVPAPSAAPAEPAGGGEREKIARIIDPKGWETRDGQYRDIHGSTMHDKDRPLAFANADYYTRDSLIKADTVLAALPSNEGERG